MEILELKVANLNNFRNALLLHRLDLTELPVWCDVNGVVCTQGVVEKLLQNNGNVTYDLQQGDWFIINIHRLIIAMTYNTELCALSLTSERLQYLLIYLRDFLAYNLGWSRVNIRFK